MLQDKFTLRNEFTLFEFLQKKPAIRKLVETVKSPDGPGGKITTWSDLIKFVRTGNGKHAELRRALSKRFSEIYNKHYLPLVKNKK
jgi:hypothetical protein